MIGLSLLVVIVVLVAVAVAGRRTRMQPHAPSAYSPASAADRSKPPMSPLQAALQRWIAAGIIDNEQASAIEHTEAAAQQQTTSSAVAATAHAPRRVPVVAEALGYLGGTLGITGLALFIARSWSDMSAAGKLALSFGVATALAFSGATVKESADAAFARLRWFLWLLSSAALAVGAVVVARDVLDTGAPRTIALTIATAVAVQNAGFWWQRPRPVQQLLCLTGCVVAVGTAVGQVASPGVAGLAVWWTGAALLAAGVRSLTTFATMTVGLGAAATVTGAGIAGAGWGGSGLLLLVATVSGLLLLTVWPGALLTGGERTVLLVVACMGGAQGVPRTIAHFARDAGLLTGLVVWACGCALIAIGSAHLLREPQLTELAGGIGVVVGAAVTGTQSVAFATTFGLLTAMALIVLGTLPGRVLHSILGSCGLLVNVPWSIGHFFPGEGRVPLLILASGVVIVGAALWLAHMGGRLRRELRHG